MKETQTEDSAQNLDMEIEAIDTLWNLSEDLSVFDAAALVAGYNPTIVERCRNDTSFDDNFHRYSIAFKAISNSITNNRLNASLRYESRDYGYADEMADIEFSDAEYVKARGLTREKDEVFVDNDNGQPFFYKATPDWSMSTISRDDLVKWLSSRGITTGFFFQTGFSKVNYLNPDHPRYAPKLAAAINAWLALEDANLIKGKSPKQALLKWLRENAAEYELSDDDGKPNENGIEECAKVANWKKTGGAPKTPA